MDTQEMQEEGNSILMTLLFYKKKKEEIVEETGLSLVWRQENIDFVFW